jgi:DnaK suppressor protein
LRESEQREFLNLLVDREKEIQKSLQHINSEISELQQLEINDDGDYASISSDGNTYSIIGSYKMEELRDIENAINKLKTAPELYGICERCGADIGRERLLVKPHALYCLSCREIVEQPVD